MTKATVIHIDGNDHGIILAGQPILDTQEGVLIIHREDGTSRTYNWDFVIGFYELDEDEFNTYLQESNNEH
ncbi:hypothetical protein ASE48_08670 [Mycobacterium sp. Root265]|uniref:hypothetical protein n=1 Tax=Mycobacterium sp. Root265 TaxID=1736504 RepID=UPI0007110BF6|nr:hypothetical protein [Mycobacterium sp. Root265]KRD08624.1 hypothetical protein ASE48_08670 [Mycobacterium sp. Root265]